MLDATLVTAQQIKLKQRDIATFLTAIANDKLTGETLLGIYTILGDGTDYADYKSGLITSLNTKNDDLNDEFAAL